MLYGACILLMLGQSLRVHEANEGAESWRPGEWLSLGEIGFTISSLRGLKFN
jgi:hypothetical protein